MKRSAFILVLLSGLALGQDKPRVFVQGKGSQDVTTSGAGANGHHWGTWGSNSTMDSHDEGMEVTKDLQKNCSEVVVTLNQSNADYTIMLNRESKHNRGLLRTNSQVEVANRAGDILGTNATHTVGNAAKDACQLIGADWSQHGRIASPDTPTPASAAVPAPAPTTQGAKLETVSAVQTEPGAEAPTNTSTPDNGGESLGDAAKRAKQRKDCLDLAKGNPSVVCK
jgi:hypothetical protein